MQYFAEIGGFDAILNLFKFSADLNQVMPVEETKQESASSKKEKAAHQIRIPFGMITHLTRPFTHLDQTLTAEFASKFAQTTQDLVVARLSSMTERDIKEVDKDEIGKVLSELRHFLIIGTTASGTAQTVETSQLYLALRFLKSENLEKRLKGLNDIRYMVERVSQAWRLERFRARGGSIY